MLLINTRPVERAHNLTHVAQQHGIEVLELPLLQLTARPLSAQLQAQYATLARVKIIVVVSPKAVEVGMDYLQQCQLSVADLQQVTWVAVGQKTAQCLAQYGIASVRPEIETSEGMLALPLFASLTAEDHVAFWRGEGGRELMMDTLSAQQINILNLVLYERSCPIVSEKLKQQLQQIDPRQTAVLISSYMSWQHWLQVMGDFPHLIHSTHYLVLGERVFDYLAQYRSTQQLSFSIEKLLDLDPEHIMHVVLTLKGEL